jgi:hypothetical protein
MVSQSFSYEADTLHRYTSITAMLRLLKTRRLTLLSPDLWEDRNDAFAITHYKERKHLKTVLAACFTQTPETYHHWKVFAHDAEGVCIEFRKKNLLSAFKKKPGIRMGDVHYEQIRILSKCAPKLDDVPFLKRYPYRHEFEFRILFEDDATKFETRDYAIKLSSILSIKLNPWIPKSLVPTLREVIHSIEGCSRIRTYQTTVLENEDWKRAISKSQIRLI